MLKSAPSCVVGGRALIAKTFACVAILTAYIFWGCSPRSASLKPRSVLLITVDTLRADYVGTYNPAYASATPNLDRLAQKSAVFLQAWSPVPLTTPAHASILTGLTPARHGVRLNGAQALPDTIPTLATELQSQGWDTGAFVAAYVLSRRFGLARGFATYDDQIPMPAYAGTRLEAERPGSQVVDNALAWLRAHSSQRFFLWVHLYEPHAPYQPPSPFAEQFPDSPYTGEVAAADAQVGRLLDALETLGLADRVVIAVAGDHGEALGEHGESTHGLLLYEGSLHVPMMVAAPGLPSCFRVTTPVSLVDLAPTLMHLAGAQLTLQAQGRNLAPYLFLKKQPPEATLFAETLYPTSFGWAALLAARQQQWKYVAAPKPELYNLAEDRGEAVNLAGKGVPQEKALRQELGDYLAKATSGVALHLDEEARRQLESLGYIAPSSPTPQTAADPKDRVRVFTLFEKAHALRSAGDYAQARRVLREALAEDPDNPVLLAEQAETLRAAGEPAAAADIYRRVLELNPADREARYNLALALREAGQEEEARQALVAAIRLDPGRAELHEALGLVYAARGAFPQAREEFARACELEPHNPRVWNNLGNALRELGELAAAEKAYRQAISLDSSFAEPWNGLGVLQVQVGNTEEAMASFTKALELAPNYLEVQLNMAIAWDEAGQREKAAQTYASFLRQAQGNPQFAAQVSVAQRLLARLSPHNQVRGKGGGAAVP